jgi:DNA-binding HxlR family transcriptional regulator
VLEVLAASRLPLGASELLERTGLRRRTLFWWLSRLEAGGCVERVGRKRAPGAVYSITPEGLRLLASYRSNFERVQRQLRTAVSGAARALLGGGASGGGAPGASGGAPPVSFARERVALCVLRRGRWVPVAELGLVRVGGLRLGRVPWWVVADGGGGFREVGFRAPYRRLRRLFRLLGVELPKRVKRVVVYAKGKEVHVDAATSMPLDEIVAVGPYGARAQYLLAFAGSALALLAAGIDKRFLQLVVALLDPA